MVAAVQVLAVVAAFAFVVGLFLPGDDGAAGGNQLGAAVFADRCAGCHGAGGQGGIGPRLAGEVAERFPDIADQVAVVTNGRGGMPAFGGRLTPEEIEAVVRFTREDLN